MDASGLGDVSGPGGAFGPDGAFGAGGVATGSPGMIDREMNSCMGDNKRLGLWWRKPHSHEMGDCTGNSDLLGCFYLGDS